MLSMGENDFFTYFPLPPESLPEAFPVHSTAPNLSMLPKSGCSGLIVSTILAEGSLEKLCVIRSPLDIDIYFMSARLHSCSIENH